VLNVSEYGITYGSLGGSTLCVRSSFGIVEVENDHLLQRISSEQSLALDEQLLEPLDSSRGGEEVAEEGSRVVVSGRAWTAPKAIMAATRVWVMATMITD
jgi:hypothetical protein